MHPDDIASRPAGDGARRGRGRDRHRRVPLAPRRRPLGVGGDHRPLRRPGDPVLDPRGRRAPRRARTAVGRRPPRRPRHAAPPRSRTVFDEAVKAVAETLDVEHVSIVERRARHGGRRRDAVVIIGRPEDADGRADRRLGRAFRASDVDFLQSVAHMLAGAIGRLRFEEQIRHDALHDALTGLPNRTLLLDRLAHALERAERHERPRRRLLPRSRQPEGHQRLARPQRGRRAAARDRPAHAERAARRRHRSPASAATSSPCCARTSTTRRTPPRSPSGSWTPSRTRSSSAARSASAPSASAWW